MAETEDKEVSWRNVMESNAEIENQMSSDWKCTICRRMLINAHSGPCGCRYCLKCITKHLEGSNKFCPCDSKLGGAQQLYLGRNIRIDQAMNSRISMIVVKCPEESCSFRDELKKIHDHVRICGKVSDKCPYHQIGCSTSMARDRINEHLQVETQAHSKLLLKWIDNLNNEMGATRLDHKCLRDQMNLEMGAIKRDHQCYRDKMNLEMEDIEDKISELESRNRKRTLCENALKQRLQHNEAEIIVIRQELQDERTRNNKERRLTEKMNLEIKNIQGRYLPRITATIGVVPLACILLWMMWQIRNLYSILPNIEDELRKGQVRERRYGELEWKIEMFSEKKENAERGITIEIFSEPFFTHENGYMICLNVLPNGDIDVYGQYMSVFFRIMKGPFDDFLPWPMNHHVTFELVNQDTGEVHLAETVHSCESSPNPELLGPVSPRNNEFGLHKFIKLDELVNTQGLIKNDTLIIKCKINLID